MIDYIKHLFSHKFLCLFRHKKFIKYAKRFKYNAVSCGLCGKEFIIKY